MASLADKAAYAATRFSHITAKSPPSLNQFKATIRRNTHISARNQHIVWIHRNSPLAKWYKEVTQYSAPPILRNTPRSHAVIIHRMRLGYRCSWEIAERNPRECKYCEVGTSEPLLQYLLQCPQIQDIRSQQFSNISIENTIEATLAAQRLGLHILQIKI